MFRAEDVFPFFESTTLLLLEGWFGERSLRPHTIIPFRFASTPSTFPPGSHTKIPGRSAVFLAGLLRFPE